MSIVAVRLEEYLRQCRCHAFNWQHFNCAHFAAYWVALAENRPALNLASLRDWIKMRDDAGGVEPAITKFIGREPMPNVNFASVGDIVVLPSRRPERRYIGICSGRYSAFLPMNSDEIGFIYTTLAVAAWHVNTEALLEV